MTEGAPLSIDMGPTEPPLLDQTIGANLEATVAMHGAGEAFVVAHQGIRQTWLDFNATVDEVAKGLIGLGIEQCIQGLLNRATDHLVQVTADLRLIDANYFAQAFRGIFFHGGPHV